MNCRSVRRWIPKYLDGELRPAQEALVMRHLAGCAACRAELDAFRQAMNALDAWPDLQPSCSLSDIKTRATALRRPAGRPARYPLPSRTLRWATALGATAPILAGAAGGVGLEAALRTGLPRSGCPDAVADVMSLGSADDPLANLSLIVASGSLSKPAGQLRGGAR